MNRPWFSRRLGVSIRSDFKRADLQLSGITAAASYVRNEGA